eukprot:337631-Pleurochrysis_carterae.AAC.2
MAMMKTWTGEMMNTARIQMKVWTEKKKTHKDNVRQRWDNRGIMNKAFKRWKSATGDNDKDERTKDKDEGKEKETTYGGDWMRTTIIKKQKPQKWVSRDTLRSHPRNRGNRVPNKIYLGLHPRKRRQLPYLTFSSSHVVAKHCAGDGKQNSNLIKRGRTQTRKPTRVGKLVQAR